jgi:hypothetical protein
MTYYYLTDTKPPKFDYTVDVKPKPPADDATVHVHRSVATGAEIYKEDLPKNGKGTYSVDLSKLALTDSPVYVEFVFTKADDPGSPHSMVQPVTLADPQPKTITVPKTAKLGDQIDLKVASWVAVTFLDGGTTGEVAETDKKRISGALGEVKWQVDGADIAGTGETAKLTIADAHVGKAIAIEAYRGTPSGRAKATVTVWKLASIEPDASVSDPTKVYVNLDADETKGQGRDITLKAHVLPAQAGCPVSFKIDRSKLATSRIVTDNLNLPAADMAKVDASATTDANGVATAKLTLSTYGGDQYRVSASLDKTADVGAPGSVATRWWEVWRAVNYEVSIMKRPDNGIQTVAADVIPKVEAGFKDVFLELRKTGADASPGFQRVVTETEASAFARGLRSGTGQPRYFQLVFVHEIVWDSKVVSQKQSFYKSPALFTLPVPDYTLDDRAVGNAITSCTYRTDKGATGTLAVADKVTLTFDAPTEVWTASVDISGIVDWTTDADKYTGITVTLGVKTWIEGGGLATDGNATIVGLHFLDSARVNNTAPLSAGDVKIGALMTAMHEPSHLMGMAANTFPEAPTRTNDTTELKKGWHCNNNGKNCTMFTDNNQTAGRAARQFCDRCKDALRLRDLRRVGYSGNAPF